MSEPPTTDPSNTGDVADGPAGRRVAVVANASDYVGPALARELAVRGCDLVLGDAAPELAGELADLGGFCAMFLDGSSGFQTGQVVGYDGGWSA